MINKNKKYMYAKISLGSEEKIKPTLRNLKNPFTAKEVFEEEISRVRREKAKNLGEWIKKLLYLRMLETLKSFVTKLALAGM